jgi:hypothetical protein
VLKEQQWETGAPSKAAVRIFFFFCIDELRRSGDIARKSHVSLLIPRRAAGRRQYRTLLR